MTAADARLRLQLWDTTRGGRPVLGLFQKIASGHVTEILAQQAIDAVVLDAEHAVFTARELDSCILAARAGGLATLVRVQSRDDHALLSSLDMGATGVMVPHVTSAEDARHIASAAHYLAHAGRRGLSNSTRAGGYGKVAATDHVQACDESVVIVAQIEDAGAVACIDEIAQVAGIDCLLVGPADLGLSLRARPGDAMVEDAIQAVGAAGRRHGKPTGIALPDVSQVERYRRLGFGFFVIGSDQSLIGSAAGRLSSGFSAA
jgi:2-keto-3-deoxy-L-rhamnonate aldolase RhmA